MTTINEALNASTVGQLKSLIKFIPGTVKSVKKDALVWAIADSLLGPSLRGLWEMLDELQRLAVAEAVYSADGYFHVQQFRAKYGRLPAFTLPESKTSAAHQSGSPSLLTLFLYCYDGAYFIPSDLAALLKAFVARPDSVRLNAVETLLEWEGDEALIIRSCEREALLDLTILLRLIDQGKLQVSEKTALPSAVTMRMLAEALAGGDFYPQLARRDEWEQEIGFIKAFCWPLLLQASGLVQRTGSKLALSPAGIKALSASPAAALRTIWAKWQKATLLDEFSRIDLVKGQKSAGRVMTALAPRRAAIVSVLAQCPVGKWVDVDDLSCFMQATDHLFNVTHDPWRLYVFDDDHGSLGYAGSQSWEVLQLRYLLCFLFEYAAPLGLIDIAYISPHNARDDYGNLWGVDDCTFLSRYDGLCYLRLTPLGAYCLGLSEAYSPAQQQSNLQLSVMPSLAINRVAGEVTAEEQMVLATWALAVADGSWRLDKPLAIAAIEKGHDIAALRSFLADRDDQDLPDAVEAFIRGCEKQGKALRAIGSALLLQCVDEETAILVASHKETTKLCLRAGDRFLVVRLDHEQKFRKLVRILGLGIVG